jgi:4-hydroxybenzoyl-CoA reductase subunit alpha
MTLAGMLFGKVLRSPYPHARILNIDTSKAERLPGVRAVVTGKDLPGKKVGFIPATRDLPPLAWDKVRFIGEGLAGVAAIDEDIAWEALDLIKVEYEPLEAVFDPIESMEPGAPQLHDHVKNNISFKSMMNFGDVEQAFKEADYIREDTFVTQPMTHAFIEPHAVLVTFDATGKLTLYGNKQSPYIVYRQLAMGLDMPLSKVRIVQTHVGGGFGGKHEPYYLDFAAALLAKKTGRPVKIVDTQEEVIIAGRQRHPMIMETKTGIKKDGTILGCYLKNIADGGAYSSVGALSLSIPGLIMSLPYRLPSMKYEGYRVYTNNKPFCGALRGHCIPQFRFAVESQLDMIAHDLGLDQVEVRLRNAVKPNELTVNGLRVTTCQLDRCIKEAADSVNWWERKNKLPPYRGIGFASGALASGARLMGHSASSAMVKVHEDGAVTLLTGSTDVGQGSNTVLSQILAEELGIALEDVRISLVDSEVTPIDPGTFGARVTFCSGNAVKAAAQDAKKQLLEVAAEALEANTEDIVFRNRQVFVKGSPDRGMPFVQVVRLAQYQKATPIMGRGVYTPDLAVPDFITGKGNMSLAYTFAAQVAEVEVDPETGKVKILKMTFSHDCGFAINPLSVEGQLEGGLTMMLGQAFYEDLIRDNGQTLNPNFLDYKMPTVMDIPLEVSPILVEGPDPEGPYGAKEAGEGTTVATIPAITNAIYHATGVRIKELPISAEAILKALGEKG